MRYWIGLGSNVGNRLTYLKKARQELQKLGRVQKCSPIFQSAPWGNEKQNDFLNAVIQLNCSLNPYRLLRKLKAIELQLGRERSEHWGPRKIDLDILEWEGEPIHSDLLNIPHPFLERRAFALLPLAWIDENFLLRSGMKVKQVLSELNDINTCQFLIEKW